MGNAAGLGPVEELRFNRVVGFRVYRSQDAAGAKRTAFRPPSTASQGDHKLRKVIRNKRVHLYARARRLPSAPREWNSTSGAALAEVWGHLLAAARLIHREGCIPRTSRVSSRASVGNIGAAKDYQGVVRGTGSTSTGGPIVRSMV
jgi:hypothetical protein